MSVEFIGMISTRAMSEIHPPKGPAIDRDYLRAFAQAHENAGFDRILVAHHSTGPDAFMVTSYIASVTERIGFMLAHRPGFMEPTLAARKLATLDQLIGGRLAVHIISGGDDEEQRRDGDFLNHDERYARTDEYLDVMRKIWTSDRSVTHEGKYYRFERAYSEVKQVQKPHLPVYFGGSSDAALDVAGRHADVYALWGETHAQVRETLARAQASAARYGRRLRFSVSFRPVLAATEDEAWARAERILEEARQLRQAAGLVDGDPKQSVGAQRLLDAAAQGDRVDKRLWTAIAKLNGGRQNSTALVGTPDQVAEALLDYYDLGVTTFLIRGFDPLEDATDYGRELIPATRALVAKRLAAQQAKAG
ncbi:MAG: LLM class flavin-dependent oxidoreductase [Parvibaculaceae bacterium]|nr:LLM class flavin-dependent oxidoreductase [Parvibaculaceae bacterium]